MVCVCVCRALIALINAVKPGIAPRVATLDPTKHHSNCILATQVAAVHLKVPKIIDAVNLASGKIDELSLLTYLSYFVEPAHAKLMKWVKRALPHSGITNFTSNWFDGILLSALLNSCFPGTMSDWMKMMKESANENATEFYETCRNRLNFDPHFGVHELTAGKVEELQVMTLIMQIQNSELRSMPEAVVISGPGLDHAKIGRETHFYINTTEAGPGKLYIDSYYKDGKRLKFKLKEKVSGILTLTYTPTAPGQIVFDILWSDVPVPNSPFSVLAMDSSLVHILDFEYHSKLREVGKTIKLKLGMKQSTRGSNISAHMVYSSGEKIDARVTELDGTTVLLEYIPPRAGKPVLHVFLGRKELIHLAVTYNVVDSGGYMMGSRPESRIYQTFEEAKFSIKSSKNLPLEVLQMTAVLTSDIQFPIRFKFVEGNMGYASFKPTLPGVYHVEVVCVNTLIQGSPFTIKVADPLSCKLHGILPSHLEINKPHIFQLDTKDADMDSIKFECIDRDISSCFLVECGHKEGEYFTQLKVSPTSEGEFMVGIKFHGQWISSSPFRVVACNPSKFEVKGDFVDKKTMVVGKPLRFRVELKQRGTIDESLVPLVRASGPSAKYTPKSHLSEDRRALISLFTPYEIGTHEVSVTYGGFHIPFSPLLVAVIAFDSHTFSATGSGLQEAFTNIPAQFVILTKRIGLVENGTLHIKVAGVVNGTECRMRIKDNDNGSYNVAYLVTTPGAYLITVQAGEAHIPGSPFKLNAQPGPEADKCTMYGSALKENDVLTIGQPIDFTVDATKGGVGKLAVKAVGPGGVLARVFMAKDSSLKGIYDIKLDPVRHGKYRVSAKWSGADIPGSPFIIKVFPGVDASKCRAYGPGLEDGSVGSVTSFNIETKDAGLGTLKVCLHGVTDSFKVDIKSKDLKDVRTLVARYFPRKPGDYLISITWSDKHIPGSPFKIKLVGESLEDDFHQHKYKPMSRTEELQVIAEEEENENDRFSELDTDFEVSSVVSKIKENPPLIKDMYSTTSLDETAMPSFATAISRQGYKDVFVHKSHRTSKSMSRLDQGKMMTFSGLRQPSSKKKHKRAVTSSSSSGPNSGTFHGQATVI